MIFLTDQSSISTLPTSPSQQSDLLYISDNRLRKLEVTEQQLNKIRDILENNEPVEEDTNVMSDKNQETRAVPLSEYKELQTKKVHMMT